MLQVRAERLSIERGNGLKRVGRCCGAIQGRLDGAAGIIHLRGRSSLGFCLQVRAIDSLLDFGEGLIWLS